MRLRDTFSPPGIDSSEVMGVKRYFAPVGWALGMLVLILDGKTALSGASAGVAVCVRTLIPSLFPFFVLSAMLTSTLPGGGLLAAGILGGYPVGAGNVARAFRAGRLDRERAEVLAVVCNCPGPSFLFGVAAPVLGSPGWGLALWGVYLVSAAALWALLPKGKPVGPAPASVGVQQAVRDSLGAMAGVCGWVVLFRTGLAVLDRWVLWLLPDWGRAAVYGALELTNGCLALSGLEPGLRFVLAAGMVSFGGLCVMVQTAGVARGLSLGLYFPGKVFQCALSMAAASCLVPGAVPAGLWGIFVVTALIFGIGLQKGKKGMEIGGQLVYNLCKP